MPFSITIKNKQRSHKIEWEKQFLIDDFLYLINSLFDLDHQKFCFLDQNGIF